MSYEFVFVNLVNFQDYILDNIKQLQLFSNNITVIVSDELIHNFASIDNITIVPTSTLNDAKFNEISCLDSSFRNGFWKLTSQRLFYLYTYMKENNKTNIIHLENDVILYRDIHIHDPSKLWITVDSSQRCIPGILFIPNAELFSIALDGFIGNKNDMENMYTFYNNHRDKCETFPIINLNSSYSVINQYNCNFNQFNMIFDAAAIGQYLGGVDPRNITGDSRGFINETCVVNYSMFSFMWKYNNTLKFYQPYIIIDNIHIPIANLHIHSKRLSNFMSTSPRETKLIPIESYTFPSINIAMDELISGERFQNCADCYIGAPHDFQCNPKITIQTEKLINIEEMNCSFNNPFRVFCYGHVLPSLQLKLHYFQNPFILITHNSDKNIDKQYEEVLSSDKIIQCYSQNVLFDHPKLHMLPIGIANSMWVHGNLSEIERISNNAVLKKNDFYFYFTLHTNIQQRRTCKRELEKKGLVFGYSTDYSTYTKELSTYKFAISPPGNGVDCHRLWECYYAGVIPIVLRSVFTEKLNQILPCVILDSWCDFDYSSILPQYNMLVEQLLTNRKYLTLSYYKSLFKG